MPAPITCARWRGIGHLFGDLAMTIELTMLALSIVLGLVQIVVASHASGIQRGYRWTAGPRDEPTPPLTLCQVDLIEHS
jgi:hypothetical protein